MKILVIDAGRMHVGTAHELGLQGNEVYYYCPWTREYANFIDYAPGVGIPEIKKVYDWASVIDQVDLVVFPDNGMGDFCHYLRSKGYAVFGAGLGEILENDRAESVKILNNLGIKTPETYAVVGVDAAMAKIKELEGVKETSATASGDYFVKIDRFRGDMDTFAVESIEDAEVMFNELKSKVGPFYNSMPICIQKKVEGIECGWDLLFDGEKFARPGIIGFENGGDYVSWVTNDLGPFEGDIQKITKYLQKMDYRGAISIEAIFDGKDFHWLDIAARFPMPMGMFYTKFTKNFAQMLYNMATKQGASSFLPENKYLGAMIITSEEAVNKWIPLKGGDKTVFFRYMMRDGEKYVVPGISNVGAVFGMASSLQELDSDIRKSNEDTNVFFGDNDDDFVKHTFDKYIKPYLDHGFDFGPAASLKEFGGTMGPDADLDQLGRRPSLNTPQNNAFKSKADRVLESISEKAKFLPILR